MRKDVLEAIEITEESDLPYIEEYRNYRASCPACWNLSDYCLFIKTFYKYYLKHIKTFKLHDYSFKEYLADIGD